MLASSQVLTLSESGRLLAFLHFPLAFRNLICSLNRLYQQILSCLNPLQMVTCTAYIKVALILDPMQIEVFSELRSKKAVGADSIVAVSSPSMTSVQSLSGGNTEPAVESIFVSADDRQLLLALLLHCADIGNSVMPYPIAER